ncbi:MAG TPA: ATP-binding protein [Gemmatimonadaceae bacterium]|nr:ATP-binding protein [Gemmatimonadaceae bacterium]
MTAHSDETAALRPRTSWPPTTAAVDPSTIDPAAAFDALPSAVAIVEPGWRVALVNAAWVALTGAPRSEQVGRELWAAFPALDAASAARAVRASMADGVARSCRVELGDGRGGVASRTLDVTVARPGGNGGGLVVELRDVSADVRRARELGERVAENDALREVARAMAAVSDSAALLETLCEVAAGQCHATGALVALLRPATSEGEEDEGTIVAVAGRNARLRGAAFPLTGTLIERAARERETVVAHGSDTASDYFRRYNAAQEVGPVLLTPLMAHGQVLGVLGVSRTKDQEDFTAHDEERLRAIADHASLALYKARLFEQAQAANQAKSNFLQTISHELRTPLTALTGYGELLADDILGPLTETQREVIERMRTVTAHLTTMIDEILSYASLDAGRERVRLSSVRPSAVLAEAAEVAAPQARHKGITLSVHAPDDVPALRTDGDKLRQILVNLADNAVKFTEPGGSVFLQLQDDPVADGETSTRREVRFRIRDTGMGISQMDQGRLFQPFAQLETGLTRRHGGTGLGLFISRRLTELLGGRLELESVPGNGSTFTVVLPG